MDNQFLMQSHQPNFRFLKSNSFINYFKFSIRHEGYIQSVRKKRKVILDLTRRWFGAMFLCKEGAGAPLTQMQLVPAGSTMNP